LKRGLRSFDAAVYTQVRQVELVGLDVLATVLLPPAIVATAILLVTAVRRRDGSRWLILAALVLPAAVFATSQLVSIPINADQVHWTVQATPLDWASVRDRWQIAHLGRIVAAVVAFGLLAAATNTRGMEHRRRGDANITVDDCH
jgi:hypothetical protein